MEESMKRGQEAFEFLSTYGVMVLIILILVGGLATINFLSTGRLIPDNCNFASGFECNDFKVTTGAVTVELQNIFGDTVTIDSLTVVRADGTECTVPVAGTLASGEVKNFIIQGCNNGQIDEKFNGNIKVNYRFGTGQIFTELGELTARVEETSTSTSVTTTTSTTATTTSTSSTTTSTSTTTTSTIGTSYSRALGATVAIDNVYIDQVSPDGGSLDGTVDLSNADTRWLTNSEDNINVTAWNFTIPGTASVTSALASCEIDWGNSDWGDLSFSYWTGSGYSAWLCTQTISVGGTYTCNLFANGLDTPTEVNNARLRCRMIDNGGPGAPGFSIDYMMIRVGYTA